MSEYRRGRGSGRYEDYNAATRPSGDYEDVEDADSQRQQYRGGRGGGRGGQHRGGGRNFHRERAPAEPIIDAAVDVTEFKNDDEGVALSTPVEKFEDMQLNEHLMRGIYSYGFERPSPIQRVAIRPFIAGRDIIAQAQSGTGKTGTFCIGVLGRINTELNATQAIILSNSRELALQIDMVFRKLGNYMGVRCNISVKGISIEENIESLSKSNKPHVVIGTPGRVLDMIQKRALNTDKVISIVMDEADEMLSKGFLEQIRDIIGTLPSTTQVGLYSATMGESFFAITQKFMHNPVYVLVKSDELTLEGIRQFHVYMDKMEYKFDTLCDIYSVLTISQSIIYCNNRRGVEDLSHRMTEANFTVSYIHGDMTPNEREITMSDFRSGKTRVLISTDLLSRGIDVQQVSVVINYDIPIRVDNYLHRIGRSGRYGRKGFAINFQTFYDTARLKAIEKYYDIKIEELPMDIEKQIRELNC